MADKSDAELEELWQRNLASTRAEVLSAASATPKVSRGALQGALQGALMAAAPTPGGAQTQAEGPEGPAPATDGGETGDDMTPIQGRQMGCKTE
eukprot:7378812-Pyramimonas_sp.AAC.1